MEWKFAKMARNVQRDKSCLAEFFNDSMIFKDFTERHQMIAAGAAGEDLAE